MGRVCRPVLIMLAYHVQKVAVLGKGESCQEIVGIVSYQKRVSFKSAVVLTSLVESCPTSSGNFAPSTCL